RQIRLRNLSGIIVIDFIDMEQEEHRKELMKHLSAELAKDRIQTKVIDMTQLNLVEVTRKKIRKPLADQIAETEVKE
ncbi:MAG: ribonuclease E/G, partial [Lachnospiraceae bacterium]|nr:ribonuclease E/G [Lachnospiraceae bacterium]